MSEKNDKIDWLNNLHNSSDELMDISISLYNRSNSFYEIGNDVMFKYLLNISKKLENISKNINNSSGKVVDEMLKSSQNNTKTMFEAVLTGMKISNDNK